MAGFMGRKRKTTWLKVWAPNIQFLKPKYSNVNDPKPPVYLSKIKIKTHLNQSALTVAGGQAQVRYKAQIIRNVYNALVKWQHDYGGGKELSTFTQVRVWHTCALTRLFQFVRKTYTPALFTGYHFTFKNTKWVFIGPKLNSKSVLLSLS